MLFFFERLELPVVGGGGIVGVRLWAPSPCSDAHNVYEKMRQQEGLKGSFSSQRRHLSRRRPLGHELAATGCHRPPPSTFAWSKSAAAANRASPELRTRLLRFAGVIVVGTGGVGEAGRRGQRRVLLTAESIVSVSLRPCKTCV